MPHLITRFRLLNPAPGYKYRVGEVADVAWVLEYYSEYWQQWLTAVVYGQDLWIHFIKSYDKKTWYWMGDYLVPPSPYGPYTVATGRFTWDVPCEDASKKVYIGAIYIGCHENYSPSTPEDRYHLLGCESDLVNPVEIEVLPLDKGVCWTKAWAIQSIEVR
jgi:hypothetical protein